MLAIGNAAIDIGRVKTRVACDRFRFVYDRQRPYFLIEIARTDIEIIVLNAVRLEIYRNFVVWPRITGSVTAC